MGREIIKQPDGKYALWSTIVDDFILTDCEPEEITAYELTERAADLIKHNNIIFETLNRGEKYRHFRTWDEAQEWKKIVHDN